MGVGEAVGVGAQVVDLWAPGGGEPEVVGFGVAAVGEVDFTPVGDALSCQHVLQWDFGAVEVRRRDECGDHGFGGGVDGGYGE
ncbi:hypothetical protein [Actinoplanes derwentensis]|uniref:hypothetical protein n=1 Tax=Actinoplanes derwentensis TaxID=113562 RepID=UPI000B82B2D7|nr:hypothetical protein [Actinoplanes derwentensis]